MKTENKKNKFLGLVIALFAFVAITSSTAKAQCATVTNNTSYGATVHIHVIGCDGAQCGGPIITYIPAGTTYSGGCPCLPDPTCNIEVFVVALGPNSISPPVMADYNVPGPNSFSMLTGCSGSGNVQCTGIASPSTFVIN